MAIISFRCFRHVLRHTIALHIIIQYLLGSLHFYKVKIYNIINNKNKKFNLNKLKRKKKLGMYI